MVMKCHLQVGAVGFGGISGANVIFAYGMYSSLALSPISYKHYNCQFRLVWVSRMSSMPWNRKNRVCRCVFDNDQTPKLQTREFFLPPSFFLCATPPSAPKHRKSQREWANRSVK